MLIVSTSLISAAIVVDSHGVADTQSFAKTTDDGVIITIGAKQVFLLNVTKFSLSTATQCVVWNTTGADVVYVVSQGSFDGDNCSFNNTVLAANAVYNITTNAGGASRTRRNTANPNYPVAGTNIEWTSGIDHNTSSAGAIFEIQNITTDDLSVAGNYSLSVNLTSPISGIIFSVSSINFTANYTTESFNITNSTLNVWYSNKTLLYKKVNTTIDETINGTIMNVSGFGFNNYLWNHYLCGINATDYLCTWSPSNSTFQVSAFTEGDTEYNDSVLETSYQKYFINITANPSVSSVSAALWFNGTSQTSLIQDGAGNGVYNATNFIDVPFAYNTSSNMSFNWEFTFTLTDSSTLKQNSSTYQQTVNKTWITECNGTYQTQFVNYTTRESENPYPKLSSTFKTSMEWWLGSGSVKQNYSFEDVTESTWNYSLCGSHNKTFNVDATIEVDAIGYTKNFHFLTGADISNDTTSIDLYLLNDTLATITILDVRDQAQNPIADVYIQIQLYDVGTDTFYTVGMAKTDFNGEDIVYLNWYETLYKFILIQDGEVIKTTDPYKISSTPQIFEIADEVTFDYDKFKDLVYSLYYNNVTKNFVLTFVKPSGGIDSGCLKVIKRTPRNDTTICNVCETSSSATLYCNIGSSGNGTFIATFYALGSSKEIQSLIQLINVSNVIYDLLGNIDATIYAIMLSGIVVAMFLISPALGIVGILVGLLLSMILGFQPLHFAEFIGIVVMGVIVILLLKR